MMKKVKFILFFFVNIGSFGCSYADATAESIFFGAMAPLYVQSDEFSTFEGILAEAKAIGVEAVSVDVWWGLVYKGRHQPDWKYYDKVFRTIDNHGLKIIPILATHMCGGGPGDNCICDEKPKHGEEERCWIPLPEWIYNKLGYKKDDLAYRSETGRYLFDAVPPWITAPLKSPVMKEIVSFYREFAKHYSEYARHGCFGEINISLGPTGELRYPSYNKGDGWEFPARGYFQAYSGPAVESFRTWVLKKYENLRGINQAWKTTIIKMEEILPPEPNLQGERLVTFLHSARGRDFTQWYSTTLLRHGKRMLKAADNVFDGEYDAIPIGMKMPGIHWQMQCTKTPRIAEITAGLVQAGSYPPLSVENDDDSYGYAPLFEMIHSLKEEINGRDIILHFTALEMDNDIACHMEQPIYGTSRAEMLVYWISQNAKDKGITLRGENALQWVGEPDNPYGENRSWVKISNAIRYGYYSGFTFLRLWNRESWEYDKKNYEDLIRAFSYYEN